MEAIPRVNRAQGLKLQISVAFDFEAHVKFNSPYPHFSSVLSMRSLGLPGSGSKL
jgi:hypothetical protein